MTTQTAVAVRPVQLVPTRAALPTKDEMSMIQQAAALALAGAVVLPKELNTPQKVAAVMLYGWELGLKPMTAVRHLYIVNGRVAPSCEVMAGLLMAYEPDARLEVKELTEGTCTMRLYRPSRDIDETYTVTWDEIKRAGLDRGDMNAKYPRDRLRYHCTKRLLRIYAPDAINNMEGPSIEMAAETPMAPDAGMYNEGDTHGYNVDRETGEIIDEVVWSRNATQETPVSASNGAVPSAVATSPAPSPLPEALTKRIKALWPKVANGARLAFRERWPAVFGEDMTRLGRIKDEAEALLIIKALCGGHDLQYNEEATLMVCTRCGQPVEDPRPDDQPFETDDNAPLPGQTTMLPS